MSNNKMQMNSDIVLKDIWTYAVKLDHVGSHKMQGLKLHVEWNERNYFKFWIWQEYFRLIILNYLRSLV